MIKISIATQFSKTPGARYYTDGPKSGQEFRETILEPLFINNSDHTIIEVDLDNVKGYGTSFLEESFGGLVRKFGRERVKARIRIVAKIFLKFKAYAEKCIDEA